MRTDPFFPTIALTLAAMLWFALAPGLEAEERWRQQVEEVEDVGYTIDVGRLRDLVAAPGTSFAVTGENLSTRAVMRAALGPHEGVPSAGVFYTLPPIIARRLAGRRVRVTLTARATMTDGAERFLSSFFLFNGPTSGWREFAPTDEFGNYQFDYEPPIEEVERPALVGIWPSVSGDDRGIEVRRIRIEIVDPPRAES